MLTCLGVKSVLGINARMQKPKLILQVSVRSIAIMAITMAITIPVPWGLGALKPADPDFGKAAMFVIPHPSIDGFKCPVSFHRRPSQYLYRGARKGGRAEGRGREGRGAKRTLPEAAPPRSAPPFAPRGKGSIIIINNHHQ